MLAKKEVAAEINMPKNEETLKENVQEFDLVTPEIAFGELFEPRWSVITFESCAVRGLSYAEAITWMNKLKTQGLSGLCIVTDEAADRISD
jgi:hypothetical protein